MTRGLWTTALAFGLVAAPAWAQQDQPRTQQDNNPIQQRQEQDQPRLQQQDRNQPRAQDQNPNQPRIRVQEQNPNQPQVQQQDRQDQQQPAAQVARLLKVKNQGEIEISRLATQRAQNNEVKQFAEKMVREHEQLAQKLDQHQNQSADRAQQRPAMQNRGNLVSILENACQIEVRHCRQMLQEKEGAKFDMAFMGGQIAAHTHMLSFLEAARGVGDEQLQDVIQKAHQATTQHLDEAKRIAKNLDSTSGQDQPVRRETRRPVIDEAEGTIETSNQPRILPVDPNRPTVDRPTREPADVPAQNDRPERLENRNPDLRRQIDPGAIGNDLPGALNPE
jgi:predicted outer membrane protein